MNNLYRVKELLDEHFSAVEDTMYSDRGLLVEIRRLLTQCSVLDESSTNNRDFLRYDKILGSMSVDKLARLNVKLVLVNMNELYWCTSSGQLYQFECKNCAIEDEIEYLSEVIQNS